MTLSAGFLEQPHLDEGLLEYRYSPRVEHAVVGKMPISSSWRARSPRAKWHLGGDGNGLQLVRFHESDGIEPAAQEGTHRVQARRVKPSRANHVGDEMIDERRGAVITRHSPASSSA